MGRSEQRQVEVDRAMATARWQLDFILSNLQHLRKVDRNGRMEQAAKEFSEMVKRNEELSPNRLSYIDGIYEKVFKGAQFDSVGVHIDRKPKGLRYG